MKDSLTSNELKVLSALKGRARYGLELVDFLKAETGQEFYLGTLYNLLSRLEKNGFAESYYGEATSERGGNRRKYYKITGAGQKILHENQKVFATLWGWQDKNV